MSTGLLAPNSEGLQSNLPDINDILKLVSSCKISEPTSTTNQLEPTSMNLWQEFNGGAQLLSLPDTSQNYQLWLTNNTEKISEIGEGDKVGTWAPQTRKPVSRSHSAITGGASSMTSAPIDTSSAITAAIGSELKSQQHRGLARTASDPIPSRARSARPQASTLLSVPSDTTQSLPDSTDRYKTELCRTFQDSGRCKYGEKCQFAHGKHELRTLTRHPKYKTDRCKTYHSTGFCPYGPRCHFVHDENELSAAVNEKRNEILLQLAEQQKHQQIKQQQQLQQQIIQKQQQQYQQLLLKQEQQLLLLALIQNQEKQGQCNSADFSSFGKIASPVESPFFSLPISTVSLPHKYPDSLGSAGTNSPPLSVSGSPPPSPTDTELISINGQRSGSIDYSNLMSQEFPETLRSSLPLSLSIPQQTASSQSFSADKRSESLTGDDIIQVMEMLKSLPASETKCNQQSAFNSFAPLSGFSTDTNVDWSYFSQSGLVL